MARRPRIGADLVDYLRTTFPPRCKRVEESLEYHTMYAGKVELAQSLIRMALKDEDHDIEIQED